jgi:hypothetical protein
MKSSKRKQAGGVGSAAGLAASPGRFGGKCDAHLETVIGASHASSSAL